MRDVVVFYADLGRDYLPLLDQLCLSARLAMPGIRLVCATPTPDGKIGSRWDHVVPLSKEVTFQNICIERARFTVSWMLSTDRPVIFSDPDIEFLKPPPAAEVGLFWRHTKPDQPINSGLVIAEPGHREFWLHYGRIAVNLPKSLHAWWCDQLAYNLMVGASHVAGETLKVDDATVTLFDGRTYCPNSDKPNPKAWALHYKGPLKGPGWEKIYVAKSGAGKSWPGSVSSTGTLGVPSSGFQPGDSASSFVPIFPTST